MITKITKEQSDMIPKYVEKFREYGVSTERINKTAAAAALKASASYLNNSEPEVWFVESPTALAVLSAIVAADGMEAGRAALTQGKIVDRKLTPPQVKMLSNQFSMISYGNLEAYWASYYVFVGQELKGSCNGLDKIVEEIVKECGPYTSFDGLYIVSERPTVIRWENEVLHNLDGPAIEWADGTAQYSIAGNRLEMFTDVRTGRKTPYKIEKANIDKGAIMRISNVERRSMMMRYIGYQEFLTDLGAKTIAVDPNEPGAELIEFVVPNSSAPSRFMKMVNPSTGEIHVERVKNTDMTTEDGWKSRIPDRLLAKYGYQTPLAKA